MTTQNEHDALFYPVVYMLVVLLFLQEYFVRSPDLLRSQHASDGDVVKLIYLQQNHSKLLRPELFADENVYI